MNESTETDQGMDSMFGAPRYRMTEPRILGDHQELAAALTALVMVTFFIVDMACYSRGPDSQAMNLTRGSLILFQAALLTCALALGNWPLPGRIIINSYTAVFALPMIGSHFREVALPLPDILSFLLIFYVAALPLGMLKLFGYRLQTVLPIATVSTRHQHQTLHAKHLPVGANAGQFSVSNLFAWTMAAALVLLIARGAEWKRVAWAELILATIPFLVVLIATIWAMFGPSLARRLPIAVSIVGLFSLSMYGALGNSAFTPAICMLGAFGGTALIFAAYRHIGYRLVRLS